MVDILVRFLGAVFALLLATYAIPGFSVENLYSAVIVALVLGVLNITIKPILTLLTLPLTMLTFGLFTLVINALLIWLAASFIEGFSVDGFLPAFLGGLVIAIVSWALQRLT